MSYIEKLYGHRRNIMLWVRRTYGVNYEAAQDEVQDLFTELSRRGENFVRKNLFLGEQILWGRVLKMATQTYVNHHQTFRLELVLGDSERPVDDKVWQPMGYTPPVSLTKVEKALVEYVLTDGESGKMPTTDMTIRRVARKLFPGKPYRSPLVGGVLPAYRKFYDKNRKRK